MKEELVKYKHYLLVLVALVIANYAIVPLSEWQDEQQAKLALLETRLVKSQNLKSQATDITNYYSELSSASDALASYVYSSTSGDKFKRVAQKQIEALLADATCTTEGIGFKGEVELDPSLSRWSIELRYSGDAACIIKMSRSLESMQPMATVEKYNVNHRSLRSELKGRFTAKLTVSLWQRKV